MHRSRRFRVGSIIAAGVIGLVALAGLAQAQQPVTLEMTVTEDRAPGATGEVTMTPLGGDQVRVDIEINGLPANEQRAVHIHAAEGAQCDTNAPIIYPLTNVSVDANGVGTSTTTITVTQDQPIEANNSYVNVHQNDVSAGGGAGPGVICADITQTFAAGTGGPGAPAPGAQPGALPATGTGGLADSTSTGWMLAGLATIAILLGGTGALAVVRQRR